MSKRLFGILALLVSTALPASTAELLGRWTAEFDSPIGVQKYVYDFKASGDALTGLATYEHSMGQGSVQLENVKVDGDKVTFIEPLSVNGNDITVRYSGTLSGNELKLTRDVGQFGTEHLTATRAEASN